MLVLFALAFLATPFGPASSFSPLQTLSEWSTGSSNKSSLPALPALSELPLLSSISSHLPDFDFIQAQNDADQFYATLPDTVLEDAKLTVPQLITKYGYPSEIHEVNTTDGYMLSLHRIPHGRNDILSGTKPVIFLQHGLMCSSADWVVPGPEKGFAYILADAGYDVWMGNARGNRYSRKHVTLDPNDSKFWEFSWHEIGTIDLPAMIDYALAMTKQQQTFYAGHSQGTTAFYVMCSERPEYNEKIKAHFSLAPIAYMGYMTSPIPQILSLAQEQLQLVIGMVGQGEFVPHNGLLGKAAKYLCEPGDITKILCTNAMFVVGGFNWKQMNTTLLPVIMGHTPAGIATKQMLHYLQEIKSGKFRRYDYGLIKNLYRYDNHLVPPAYQLSKVTSPVYIFYSGNDWLSSLYDVNKLIKELGNLKKAHLIADTNFNHNDYLYAIDAPELVYYPIMEIMRSIRED